MRKILAAAGVIAAFFSAAIVAVLVITGRDPAPPAAPAASPDVPEAAPVEEPPSPTFAPLRPAAVAAPTPVPAEPFSSTRYEPPQDSWEAITPVARAAALGAVGAAVGRDLMALQPQLSRCFAYETAARFGQAGYSVTQDPERMEDQGSTVLVLQVETSAGSARIVDAPLETRGSAEDGTVSCAQSILRGRTVSAPSATPGRRHRIVFHLHP